MEYEFIYLRDEKQVSKEKFDSLFDEDLNLENLQSTWDIQKAAISDLNKYSEVVLNGHLYQVKERRIYDIASELLDDFICNGDYDLVFDVLRSMPNAELEKILCRIDGVHKDCKTNKFIQDPD